MRKLALLLTILVFAGLAPIHSLTAGDAPTARGLVPATMAPVAPQPAPDPGQTNSPQMPAVPDRTPAAGGFCSQLCNGFLGRSCAEGGYSCGQICQDPGQCACGCI